MSERVSSSWPCDAGVVGRQQPAGRRLVRAFGQFGQHPPQISLRIDSGLPTALDETVNNGRDPAGARATDEEVIAQAELDRPDAAFDRVVIRESIRTNAYWLGQVLNGAQENPARLDWARSRTADYETISAAELSALARRFLRAELSSSFASRPSARGQDAAAAVNVEAVAK